jgi:hypothetical protein
MIATVIEISNERIIIRVRRSAKNETLYSRPTDTDLRPGDRIEVGRQTNNPYPLYVRRAKTD